MIILMAKSMIRMRVNVYMMFIAVAIQVWKRL